MSEPRFVVTAFTGYAITGSNPRQASRTPTTDYYVQDRAFLYAVVARFGATPNGRPMRPWRQLAAERECDRLNEWAAQESKRGELV